MQLQNVVFGQQSMNGSLSMSPRRTACCLTGQMRGYPLSRFNWQHSIEAHELLGTSNFDEIDWFLVSSDTPSYQWFRKLPEPFEGYIRRRHLTNGCQRYVHSDGNWSWRETEAGLEFNMKHFPQMRKNQHGTTLIQHFQLGKCREMVLQAEQRHKFVYDRIARLRTDVIFPHYKSVQPSASQSNVHCLSHGWLKEKLGKTAHWAFVHDFALVGTRAVMIDFFLAGLLHLQGVRYLQGIQVAWQVIRERANSFFGRNISIYLESATSRPGCPLDLISSTGPPQSLFFLQTSEAGHIRACLQLVLSPEDCRQRFFDAWHIHQMEQSGLNFTYDWPATSCLHSLTRSHDYSSAASCLARAHERTFGAANLIGDPKKWGFLSSNETPGYTWASISDEFKCNARDGWIESRHPSNMVNDDRLSRPRLVPVDQG